jgi:hypothetical protein
MRIANIMISALTLTAAANAYALMCPSNFNEISVGDSIESVKAQCGAPSGTKSFDSAADTPQEWNYYVNPTGGVTAGVTAASQATLKTTVAFANGKVTNMSVNGVGVTNTAICGGTIQVGDSEDTVKAACGKPQFINRGTGSQAGTAGASADGPTKVTELTYPSGGGMTTLVFENGIFKERKEK